MARQGRCCVPVLPLIPVRLQVPSSHLAGKAFSRRLRGSTGSRSSRRHSTCSSRDPMAKHGRCRASDTDVARYCCCAAGTTGQLLSACLESVGLGEPGWCANIFLHVFRQKLIACTQLPFPDYCGSMKGCFLAEMRLLSSELVLARSILELGHELRSLLLASCSRALSVLLQEVQHAIVDLVVTCTYGCSGAGPVPSQSQQPAAAHTSHLQQHGLLVLRLQQLHDALSWSRQGLHLAVQIVDGLHQVVAQPLQLGHASLVRPCSKALVACKPGEAAERL